MNMWMMYLIMKLDDVQATIGTIGLVALLGLIVLRVIYWMMFNDTCGDEDDKKIFRKRCKFLRVFYFIAASLAVTAVLMPDTHTAAAMYVVPKVINNKQIQKMPNKLVTLANDWMDEQIKSIKENKDA